MFTMRVPAFRSLPSLALAAIATVLLCALLYYLPQRWHVGSPAALPLTRLDRAVPFWPLSGLVYFAVFPFLAGTFLLLRCFDVASRFLYASLLAQTLGMVVFVLWPTTYPRALFALPGDAGPLAAALVNFCRGADLPLNCLPSLHVSTVVLCIATLWHRSPGGKRAALLLAGAAMIASTLTFKQHYLIDAIAGAALGYTSWWICIRWRGLVLRDWQRVPAGS